MKTLIMINGLKRSGKDFTTEIFIDLLQKENVKRIGFADPIKRIISKIFKISLEDLENFKNNPREYKIKIEKNIPHGHLELLMTLDFREILQIFGSEAMKPEFGNDVWAKIGLEKAVKATEKFVVISDYRFLIEYDFAKKYADKYGFKLITINIFNDDLKNEDCHSSEKELLESKKKFDFVIDNTGRPNIRNKIKEIIQKIS